VDKRGFGGGLELALPPRGGERRRKEDVHNRRAGVGDGDLAVLDSRVHSGTLRVHVSDEMRPGVVSLPHGWGHAASAPWEQVAGRHPGVSANDWTDDQQVEAIVGQSILNGVPVRLRALASSELPTSVAS